MAMLVKKTNILDTILAAFSRKQLQEGIMLAAVLQANDLTFQNVVDALTAVQEKTRRLISNFPKCPDCGRALRGLPVNTTKGNQVGEDYKSVWTCSDWKNCGYEYYSLNTVQEKLNLLVEKKNGTR